MKYQIGVKMSNFKRTFILPFRNEIPNYLEAHLNQKAFFKRYAKYLRRVIYIFLKGQLGREIFSITSDHKRIL